MNGMTVEDYKFKTEDGVELSYKDDAWRTDFSDQEFSGNFTGTSHHGQITYEGSMAKGMIQGGLEIENSIFSDSAQQHTLEINDGVMISSNIDNYELIIPGMKNLIGHFSDVGQNAVKARNKIMIAENEGLYQATSSKPESLKDLLGNLDRDKNKQKKMDSLLVDEIHGTSFEVLEGKENIKGTNQREKHAVLADAEALVAHNTVFQNALLTYKLKKKLSAEVVDAPAEAAVALAAEDEEKEFLDALKTEVLIPKGIESSIKRQKPTKTINTPNGRSNT